MNYYLYNPPDDDYQEVMNSIRNYSNLRFAIFTVFLTIMFALFRTFFKSNEYDIASYYHVKSVICLSGLSFSVFFLCIEIALNQYMEEFEKHAKKLKKDCHLKKRPKFLTTVTPVILKFKFLIFIVIWGWFSYRLFCY
jgi:hypothetical protein